MKDCVAVKAKPFLSTALWVGLGNFTQRGLAVAINYPLARILGVASFGVWAAAQATISMFVVGLAYPLSVATAKRSAEDSESADSDRKLSSLLWCVLSLGCVAGLVLLLGAPVLAGYMFRQSSIVGELRIGAAVVVSSILLYGGLSLALGLGLEKSAALSSSGVGIAAFICTIAFAQLWGVSGALAASAVGGFASFGVIAVVVLWRRGGVYSVLRKRPDRESVRALCRLLVSNLFTSALWGGPINWLCLVILARSAHGLDEVGKFHAANVWFGAALFIPNMINQAGLPVLVRARQNGGSLWSITARLIVSSIVVSIPVVIAVVLASPMLMSWYGIGVADGSWALSVLMLCAIMHSLSSPVISALLVAGREGVVLWGHIVGAACYMIATLYSIEIRGGGAVSLAVARGAGYLVVLCILGFGAYVDSAAKCCAREGANG